MFILTNTNIEPASKKAGSIKTVDRVKNDKLGIIKWVEDKFIVYYKSKKYTIIYPFIYIPKILFSTPLNDSWEIGKPSKRTKLTLIDTISLYWSPTYIGMKVSIISVNEHLKYVILDVEHLDKQAEIALTKWTNKNSVKVKKYADNECT